jgi:phosphate transport system substrate-binding protein
MLLSDFGQEEFVKPAGYSTLTDERQKKEMQRLPEPEA